MARGENSRPWCCCSTAHALLCWLILFVDDTQTEGNANGLNECVAGSHADISKPPPFTCSLSANVTVNSSCDVSILERMEVPWASRRDRRCVKYQEGQTLVDPVAYQITPSGALKRMTSSLRGLDARTTCMSFTPANMENRTQLYVFQYVISKGVLKYRGCEGDGVIEEDVLQEHAITDPAKVRMTKWQPGGIRGALGHVAVSFEIADLDPQKFFGASFSSEKNFTVNISTTADSHALRVTLAGQQSPKNASLLNFAVFYAPPSNLSPRCNEIRSCQSETLSSKDASRNKENDRIALILVLFASFTVFALCFTLLAVRSKCFHPRCGGDDDNLGLFGFQKGDFYDSSSSGHAT